MASSNLIIFFSYIDRRNKFSCDHACYILIFFFLMPRNTKEVCQVYHIVLQGKKHLSANPSARPKFLLCSCSLRIQLFQLDFRGAEAVHVRGYSNRGNAPGAATHGSCPGTIVQGLGARGPAQEW